MNNSLPPSTQENDKIDFSKLLTEVGEDFDIPMASQQFNIPATIQNCLATPSKKDECFAGSGDFTTVYERYNQNASGSTNHIVASVVDPLLLSKYIP